MGYKVAVMGVTGAVGQEMLKILEERDFPVDSLLPLASERSKGKKIKFKGCEIPVAILDHNSFKGIQIVLASAGASISKEYVSSAVKAGAIVIDNTSYFRMHDDVPLVVPEVNPEDIKKHKGIIANPNCSTIIMILPLFPIYKTFGLKRVLVSTYQASSGAGAKAMNELIEETRAFIEGRPYRRTVFPLQYAFNLFPHNAGVPDENGYVMEEVKMIKETRKMFHDDSILIAPTCVRVPVLRAHSESLNIQMKRYAAPKQIYELMNKAPGVKVLEERDKNRWPTPVDASGKDPVLVGRIRTDLTQPNTIEMWVVGDQIRKGAALNAVQIAELL